MAEYFVKIVSDELEFGQLVTIEAESASEAEAKCESYEAFRIVYTSINDVRRSTIVFADSADGAEERLVQLHEQHKRESMDTEIIEDGELYVERVQHSLLGEE